MLEDKIKRAIKLLQAASMSAHGECLEVCYSGGKDSDIILELVKMAGIKYRAIYRNTTIDPPGTIAHCKRNGVEIMQPKERFFALVRKKGFPTRRARFCCKDLKEYKILDNAVQGIRQCESTSRKKRYKEPTVCRVYGAKANHVNVILPILEWTDKDVEQFIAQRGIKCHPLYYDEQRRFHVERRLGCLGCPMPSDNGVADFLRYPKLLKAWAEAGKAYLSTHPNCQSKAKFGNVYDLIYYNLFCATYEDYLSKKSPDLWGGVIDCKQLLETYFNIKL